ncbi:hypothetical protein A3K73_05020 [Candidatus Pacearchaeota archaeon RBG_13_36_9]|nr:MAG: hypothetical protein A3K73_05020 [Candidatus Pacearchaeota archaeon RBG_13_36_9]
MEREDEEQIEKKVDLCIGSYKQAYGRFPAAVIVTDGTMHFLRDNGMLKNYGEAKLAYSGMAVATAYGKVGAYWMARFDNLIEVSGGTDRERRSYHKAGGVYPFILATKRWFPVLRRLQGIDMFKDSLDCDIGVPVKQLEKDIARKVADIKKRK